MDSINEIIKDVLKISAFSNNNKGGNPAGVWIGDKLPNDQIMQDIAKIIGFSETVFATPHNNNNNNNNNDNEKLNFRVRYFSPEEEVDFCGHATIALGFCLGNKFGSNKLYNLFLNKTNITVESKSIDNEILVSLTSPKTSCSKIESLNTIKEELELFGLNENQINKDIGVGIGSTGPNHLILPLINHQDLKSMKYDFSKGKELMKRKNYCTIMLVYKENQDQFYSRNAFAFGGVYEDPATGSASAAFFGYLKLNSANKQLKKITLYQGDDMGKPSIIIAEEIEPSNLSFKISGFARIMDYNEN